jgi:hypothetical protein
MNFFITNTNAAVAGADIAAACAVVCGGEEGTMLSEATG